MPALDKTKPKPLDRPRDKTVDPAEVARFAAMAEEWWDPKGKFAPLHRFNPVRLEFIRDRIAGSKLAIIDAAHISNVEQPDVYKKTALDFLTA